MNPFKLFLGWLSNGPLDRILESVDRNSDNETARQENRGKVIIRYAEIDAETRAAAMQNPWFWRVWALFAAPLGIWFAAIVLDTVWTPHNFGIPDIPLAIRPYADTIFQSIFGSGAVVGGLQAISAAIRGRR